MSDSVKGIARLLTEDPDIFSDYQAKFSEHTVLDEEIYGDIVGILKDVAEKNGLILDHTRLKVKFNPAGISIQNIHLEAPDPRVKRDLIARVAEVTGDDNIKHTFNKNLRVNLYNAINKEFADRVREELNLEVTHQSTDPDMATNSSEVLPMATFAQPAVTAEKPEEEMDMAGPMGAEPEGGPEAPAPEGEAMGMGMGGMGGMGGLGGGGMGPMGDLGGLEEPPSPEEGPEGGPGMEEPEAGPFGVEPPEEDEGEAEEAPPLKPGEEDEMLSFENVQRIADMLTEDPDIFED
jgi:hypothetical protein